jgi:O-antigen/teichoic acid export membrane protein
MLVLVAQQAVGVPVVLWAGWGLQGLVVNVGIGWALGFLVGVWRLRRDAPAFRWESPRRSLKHWREAMRFGGPVQLANVFTVLHSQLDKFLLPRFVALAAVTPYELAYRAIVGAYALPQLLMVVLLPVAAGLHATERHERLRQLYRRANRYVLTSAAMTLAAALGAADRLFTVWLGPGHGDAALILRGLALSTAVWTATTTAVTVARGVGRTEIEAWFALLSLVSHAALSLWLLPTHGLPGSLVAIISANLIGAVFVLWRLATVLGWPRSTTMLEPLGAPLVGLLLGGTVSFALDRIMPAAPGFAGWCLLAIVAAAGAATALMVALGTRYVGWREATEILFRRGGAPA